MNCTSYVFSNIGNYFQYPNDFTNKIFQEATKKLCAPTQIYIHRDDNLMYYLYIQELKDSQYLGICILLNDAYFTNIDRLFSFFRTSMNKLHSILNITTSYDCSQVQLKENATQIAKFLSEIQTIDVEIVTSLPPIDLSVAKNSRMIFSHHDNNNDIIKASIKYRDIFVCKKDENTINDRNFSSTYCNMLHRILKSQCNPSRYIKSYDPQKLIIANSIFCELDYIKQKPYALIKTRKEVESKLGINCSSKVLYEWLYESLSTIYNPNQYIGDKSKKKKLREINKYYNRIQNNKFTLFTQEDTVREKISALEKIAKDAGLFEQNLDEILELKHI